MSPRLRRLVAALLPAFALAAALPAQPAARARLDAIARRVTITRDDWGIPHIRGKTDADAVFGMVYAQAEDDFNRVETNYYGALGRAAEAEGPSAVWQDLRRRLFVDEATLRRQYAASPAWLRRLMDAWADGLNYYLLTHPAVTPKVIRRFEPWMALSFSEGSIGGDIEAVSLAGLQAFYGGDPTAELAARATPPAPREPSGSNGVAIAPSRTKDGHALLLINPHTSFFFREELQVTSDEGLNAYGAVTWGQFFVYQGFNDRAGWMHTTSTADVVDEYAETVRRRGDRLTYRYDGGERPVQARRVTIRVKGEPARTFTVYRTHHGPVVRKADGRWITVRMLEDPVRALQQSYLRTKARGYAAFRRTMALHTNTSNNTLYADADGTIAYFHANFVPRRDPRFDWTKPVDGSDPATEWRGVHDVEESPFVRDPASGWVYNTNNGPWSAAGADSPDSTRFARYFDTSGENWRGLHAVRLFAGARGLTIDGLLANAFDPWLPFFAQAVPPLLAAWERLPAGDARRARLAGPVAALRAWDHRWSAPSVATSVAVFWGEALRKRLAADLRFTESDAELRALPDTAQLGALEQAVERLAADFGRWDTPWGEINRFQRLTGDIVQPFSDAGPSIPVPFTSAAWGSLASFGAQPYPGTKRWYGTSGNSFVAVVEFGPRVRARAVTAGGVNGVPGSRHFNDQAERYAAGALRPVYFHPDELAGHVERRYRPGE